MDLATYTVEEEETFMEEEARDVIPSIEEFCNVSSMTYEVSKPIIIRFGNGAWAEITTLPSNVLEINPLYQRSKDTSHVRKIVENFCEFIANPLKVVERDGHYYIYDGQHTLESFKVLYKKQMNQTVFPVLCIVYHGINRKMECELFEKQTGEQKRLNINQKFKPKIERQDPDALKLKGLVEKYGFKISMSSSSMKDDCYINSLGFLQRFAKYEGYDKLERLLKILSVWEGKRDSLSNTMIKGITYLIKYLVHNPDHTIQDLNVNRKGEVIPDFDDSVFMSKIEEIGLPKILSDVDAIKNTMSGPKAVAEVLISHYNMKTKKKENHLNFSKIHWAIETSKAKVS